MVPFFAVHAQDEIAHAELGGRVQAEWSARPGTKAPARATATRPARQRMRCPSESWRTGVARSGARSSASVSSFSVPAIFCFGKGVDVAQEREGIRHWQIPPKLAALAEHHANVAHVPRALFPRACGPARGIHQPSGVRMPERILMVVDLPAARWGRCIPRVLPLQRKGKPRAALHGAPIFGAAALPWS